MYPLDRRKMAQHIYSILLSLRKTSLLLQVSHTSVARWLKNIERKKYVRSSQGGQPKSIIIVEVIRAAVSSNPFITSQDLVNIVKDVFGFLISRQLANCVVRRLGFSRKRARFFGKPLDLPSKTNDFLLKRDALVSENRRFVAVDETSFGRHGAPTYGYAPKGEQLRIQKQTPHFRTISVLAMADVNGIIAKTSKHGSFNTLSFKEFLTQAPIESGTVILLDNVAFHKARCILELATEKGWLLLYTPPYSPWFNPIEGMFSIIKRHFYKYASIDNALNALNPHHANSFFRQSFSLRGMPK